jgi:hypothetical protein
MGTRFGSPTCSPPRSALHPARGLESFFSPALVTLRASHAPRRGGRGLTMRIKGILFGKPVPHAIGDVSGGPRRCILMICGRYGRDIGGFRFFALRLLPRHPPQIRPVIQRWVQGPTGPRVVKAAPAD